MANRAFPSPAGLASGIEGLGWLRLAAESIFTPTILGAQTLSGPRPCNLEHKENNSSGKRGGAVLRRRWATCTPLCISFAPREDVRQTGFLFALGFVFGFSVIWSYFHQLYEPQGISELLGRADGLAIRVAHRVLYLCLYLYLYLSRQPLTPPPLPSSLLHLPFPSRFLWLLNPGSA